PPRPLLPGGRGKPAGTRARKPDWHTRGVQLVRAPEARARYAGRQNRCCGRKEPPRPTTREKKVCRWPLPRNARALLPPAPVQKVHIARWRRRSPLDRISGPSPFRLAEAARTSSDESPL